MSPTLQVISLWQQLSTGPQTTPPPQTHPLWCVPGSSSLSDPWKRLLKLALETGFSPLGLSGTVQPAKLGEQETLKCCAWWALLDQTWAQPSRVGLMNKEQGSGPKRGVGVTCSEVGEM